MAGETIKTKGLVLEIRPWSRTSHVTTWLTPDHGPVATLVKGAVRPKSAFLGQYDLFYTCELVYYARSTGELHAIREVFPLDMREHLRGDYRATALASYAAHLVREHCPHGGEAAEWFAFLERALARASGEVTELDLLRVEAEFLKLAGLSPDFTGVDGADSVVPFAIDLGRVGHGSRTVQLPAAAVGIIKGGAGAGADLAAALKFFGIFMRYHLDMPPDIRRTTLQLLGAHRSPPNML